MTPDEMLDAIDMQPVVKVLSIVGFLFLFATGWMIAEAQEFIEPVCDLPFNVHYSIDYTELMFEGHQVETQSDRWWAIREQWVEIFGGGRMYLGTYNVLGQWAVVWLTLRDEGRIYVEMGRNWAIGGDKQLHTPYCSEVLPADAFRFFGVFPECTYPVWCD